MTTYERVRLRETEDEDDERDTLRNWESIRIPTTLMDSGSVEVTRRGESVTRDAHDLHDGLGNPAGYKPGFVFGGRSDAARKSVEDAYREYVDRVSNAWRGPPSQGPGTITPAADQSGDPREAAFNDYWSRVSNAWRADR